MIMTSHKSQRDAGFNGGIQKGQVATDAAAKKLDEQVKNISEQLQQEFPGLTYYWRLPNDIIPDCRVGCEPDGGAWFLGSVLVAVFEAKKQNLLGNAIERWFKNNYICRQLNPAVNYVTFATGKGSADDCIIPRTLSVAHRDGFNKIVPNKNSCFLSPDGFTNEEIYSIMKEVLSEVE
jgi:hypothetical protein